MFYIGIMVVILGYSTQIIKIFRKKSANGVSKNAYLTSLIAVTSTMIVADNIQVQIIAFISGIFSLATVISISYFNHINNAKTEQAENKYSLYIAMLFSFFMVYGVAQSLKSFKIKGVTHNVSILSYSIWFAYCIILMSLAIDIKVVIAYFVSGLLYSYIIYRSVDFEKINYFKKFYL